MQSGAIRGHQWSNSTLEGSILKSNQMQSVTIRANQCQSETIQRQSEAISCNQGPKGAHDVRRALSSKWAGYIFHARDFIGSFWEPNTIRITHRESGLSYFSPIMSPIHAYPTAFDGGLSVRAPHSLPRGTTRASMPGAHRGRTSL